MTSSLTVDASVVSIFEALHHAVTSKGYNSPSILEANDLAVFVLSVEDKATAGVLAAYHHSYQLLKDAFPVECDYVLQCSHPTTVTSKSFFTPKDSGWGPGWKPGEPLQIDPLKTPTGGKIYVFGDPQAMPPELQTQTDGVAVGTKVFQSGDHVVYEWSAPKKEDDLPEVTEPEPEPINMPAEDND